MDSREADGAAAGRLAALFAQLYPHAVGSERIVDDAGLDTLLGYVNFEAAAELRWFHILSLARSLSKVKPILTEALREYPDEPRLVRALEDQGLLGPEERSVGIAGAPKAVPAPTPLPTPVLRRLSLEPERRLIDRIDAVALIRSELEHATTDHVGRRLLLIGDSGVGKSRLAEQGMRLADKLGMVVLQAQCIDQHAEPLLPMRDCLAKYREQTPVRDLLLAGGPTLVDYVPFVESFLRIGDAGSLAAPLGGSGGQGVYEGLAQVVVGLAEQAGLCLVVEDLTDADQDTLSFLEYLGRKGASSRVLTITTVKQDLLEPELIDRIDKWTAAGCGVSPVPPLAREDAADFIALLRNGQQADVDWIDEVYALTGGNPFFIEQVVSLVAEGPRPAAAPIDVPDRIEAVLKRRLRRVTGDSRAFLDAAAVALEVTHRLNLIAHVAGTDIDTASDRLVEAAKLRFLTEDVQGSVGFAQNLLKRVLYEELSPRARLTMHVRAAEWLEREELFASASHHYNRAERMDDMVRTALKGAEQAEHAGTYRSAVQLYLRARPAGDSTAIGLQLARVYLILGAWPEAEEVLKTLPADLGEARVLRSDLYFVRGAFDRALRELRLASQAPSVDRVEALIRLADIHLYLGRLSEAKALATHALGRTTDQTTIARCLAGIGTCLYHMGDIDGAEQTYLEEMKALPEEVEKRDRFAYTVALHNLGIAREARGDWAGAKRFHEEALRLRMAVSAAREVGHSRHSLIRCEIGLGSFDVAREMVKDARAAAIALGEELEQGKLDHTEARIELLTGGDAATAVKLIDGALERFRDLSVAYDLAHATFSLASAYAASGASRRALEEAASARALMERGGFWLLASLFPEFAYSYRDRVQAGLLAYAAGDAVGLPWERMAASEIDASKLPSLHATKEWPAGATSDDTALTLLVAEHLIASGRPDGLGFMGRLMAAAPSLKGLGPSTTAAIEGFRQTKELPTANGNTNGAVMRSLPVGWALPIDRVQDRRDWAIELSRVTHPGPEASCAGCIGAACAAWAIEGASPAMLLDIAREEAAAAVKACAADPRINDMLEAVAAGDWQPDPGADDLDPYETLTRALWCVVRESTLSAALLAAVRLGGDTDTVAALVGGLLGCQRSPATVRQEIPWIEHVHLPDDDVLERTSRGITDIRVGRLGG